MKNQTESDPYSEDRQTLECPWCSNFLSEELDDVDPDIHTEITCPNCHKKVSVHLEILNLYTGTRITE